VLRRALAYLVLMAVIGSPAVTSSRLFCRYTGVEIVGCDESRVPAQSQLRQDNCCLKRTFHALEAARMLTDDGSQFAPPPAIATFASVPEVHGPAALPSPRPLDFSDAGPPVFLTNRALLI